MFSFNLINNNMITEQEILNEAERQSDSLLNGHDVSAFMRGAKIIVDKRKLPKTSTEASVNFALHWLWGFVDKQRMCTTTGRTAKFQLREDEKTELEKIGIDVVSIYGLMQGCCHLICECDMSIFSNDLVEKAKGITKDVFKKFIKYHRG